MSNSVEANTSSPTPFLFIGDELPEKRRIPITMKILAIGSHPDDLEYGCGGTLAHYAEAGHHVTMLIVTGGEHGGEPGIRESEQHAAANALGADEVLFGGYEDTRVPQDQPFISFLESTLHRVEPDMIFVHHKDDTHQDHRTVHTATLSAARYVPNLLFYEGPTTINFQPTIFVDVSTHIEKKIQALKAHSSQVAKTRIPNTNILDMALATATFRGTQGRVRSAEGFCSARLFLRPTIEKGAGNPGLQALAREMA
jgi:LmbE family N-acetylglucosaminyl deacetylase